MNQLTGKPMDRVDGRLKVTGKASYSAEFPVENLAYGYTVQSTITKGRIRNMDTKGAESAPGVLGVMTYKNSISLHQLSSNGDPGSGKFGEKDLLPLQNDRIFYDGQHIAVVIAETIEMAEYAATLIEVEYDEEKAVLEMEQALGTAYKPRSGLGNSELQVKWGDAAEALGKSEVTIEQTYSTPVYHHNPMEPHATTAVWKGDELTVYDSTQSVLGSRAAIAQMLGIPEEKVRLISLFIGGGFGSKGFTWAHAVLAPMAAKQVGRPVKIVLGRNQLFTCNGRRSRTIQQIGLGTDTKGKLISVRHLTTSETSFVDEFVEQAGVATKILYDTPNLEVSHSIIRLNRGTPCPTRAPGEAPGTFALESAMDELAYKLKIDPLELRLINHADINPQNKKPWSEKSLKACYQRGADAIGWSKRNPIPRSMREGNILVGYGMATAVYPANRSTSSAKVELHDDGNAIVSCCTQDIGTGTYTILTQIAADALGISAQKIVCKLGDSTLPRGVNSGGSQTSASSGPPVRAAALQVRSRVLKLAIADSHSPLYGLQEEAIDVTDGKLFSKQDGNKAETYQQLLSRQQIGMLVEEATTNVSTREGATAAKKNDDKNTNRFVKEDEEVDHEKYAFQSFGAQFAKVLVDPDLGTVKVAEIVGVMDIGKVLNQKTAQNQIMGGMIFGIGMALMEETVYDPNRGRIVTRDLANYLVPVHADIPDIHIEFIDEPDPYISPIGSRGLGEIGITGITAAIVNAIYHATGKRIRDLPVTPDKLL
jgi:xanthine dehydrogenase YagR molybdenum-binding subunit